MKKTFNKILATVMIVMMAVSIIPQTDFSGLFVRVNAAETLPDDNEQINKYVPDVQLCNAIRQIVGGSVSAEVTIKDLRTYAGDIDLSAYDKYDMIESLEGLGYARKAANIDASMLTKVKRINDNEFQQCSFENFGMPQSVEEIGKEAFFNCQNLTYVKLPDTLKKIQSEAFKNCKKLDGIVFPDGIEKIGNNAFAVCESITSIVIPDGINSAVENSGEEATTGLGAGIFDGCVSLSSVKLGAGMTAIPATFLSNTSSLHEIEIPSNIINIMDGAFTASGIYSIDLSKNDKMTAINTSVFRYCDFLSSVKLPDSIERIEEGAFAACRSFYDFSCVTKLKKIKFIGNNAFENCALQDIEIPATVETIGAYAFAFCEDLQKVVIDDFTTLSGDMVKNIGDYAFAGCSFLESVELPTKNEMSPQVTIEIGKYAFSKCRHLKEINFPANVVKIGDYGFSECGISVTDWQVENDEYPGLYFGTGFYIETQYISDEPKEGYKRVLMYSIADDQKYYQPNVFYIDDTQLARSKREASANAIKVIIENSADIPNMSGQDKMHIQHRDGLKNVDLSKCSQLQLGAYAFYKCVNLETVELPKELTEIPKYAFAECFSYKYAGTGYDIRNVASQSDTQVEDRVAKGFPAIYDEWYYGLAKVSMGDKIETIGDYAFFKAYNLEINDELSAALKKIGNSAFRYCESLGEVIFPRKLESIATMAFADTARAFKEYLTPNKMVEIDASYAANLSEMGTNVFYKSSIKDFIMDKTAPLNKIEENMFFGCQYLDTVVLSKNVADVKNNALGACFRLKSVNIYDGCTLEKECIRGGIRVKDIPISIPNAYTYSANDAVYYATNLFNLAITPLNDYVSARQNKQTNLPLYTIDSDSSGYYTQVKIADNVYILNPDTGIFDGETELDRTYAIPKMVKLVNVAQENSLVKSFNSNAYGIEITGCNEGRNIAVNVQEYLVLPVYSDSKNSVNQIYSPTVTYTMDVTAVPCTDIKVDENQVVSITATTNGKKIEPQFLSETGEEVTDEIEWEILTGKSYINMTVAQDGKSVTVKSTGVDCGSASIRVKAGKVIKTIYVDVVAPCRNVSITPSEDQQMMIGDVHELTATATYAPEYDEMSKNNPDKIVFTSKDESVVKVEKSVYSKDGTVCTLKAVGAGMATIIAEGCAGNASKEIKVYVSSENLNLVMKDGEGNTIDDKSTVEMRKRSASFYYELSENLGTSKVNVEIEDESVAKAEVWASGKRITFNAQKTGKTKVTIYPQIGTKANGIEIELVVNSDVTVISLSSKTIAQSSTASVFSYMDNQFGTRIKEANATNYKTITDNTIIFESSNEEYAVVDNYGNVTVKKYSEKIGKVTITAKALNKDGEVVKQATTTVTLQKPDVKSVNVTGITTVYVGSSENFKISVFPADGNYRSISASVVKGSSDAIRIDRSNDYKSMKITGLRSGTVVVRVSVISVYNVVASKDITIRVVKIGKPSFKKPKRGKKKLTLKWKKVSGVSGYQIQKSKVYYAGFKTVKTIKSSKTVKYTVKKLKSKKAYWFRIRAYKITQSGAKIYGEWSKVKQYKAK